jgi:hypothetical protein
MAIRIINTKELEPARAATGQGGLVLFIFDDEANKESYIYVPRSESLLTGQTRFTHSLNEARHLDPKANSIMSESESETNIAYSRIEPFITDEGIPDSKRQPFRNYLNSPSIYGPGFATAVNG